MTPEMATHASAAPPRQRSAADVQTVAQPADASKLSEPQPTGQVLPMRPRGAARAQRVVAGVGAAVALCGVAALVGWVVGGPLPTAGSGSRPALWGQLAVAVGLGGLALLVAGLGDRQVRAEDAAHPQHRAAVLLRRLGWLWAGSVGLLGGVALIDALGLVRTPLHGPGAGRMAITTVLYFVAVGTALLLLKVARWLGAASPPRADLAGWQRATPDLAQALRERDLTRLDLERTNHDLDEFAYAASHDLRAPLRGIANLAQWVEEDLGTNVASSTRQQLNLLRGRVHRMEALIDDILKYSRVGRSAEPPSQVTVADLLAETIQLVGPPPAARIEVRPDMPQLLTERAQLQQVFANLLSNAIKHSRRDDPHVVISAEDQGDFVRFVVADNGPGVAPQYHDRIWGMFQTLVSRDQVEGSGIGLATVKKLVERRGGRVGVESAEGQGARFFFLWPKHNPPY